MPIKMELLPLEVQIFVNDTVDFLKSVSPNLLPGVLELQRRDLMQRASGLVAFDDEINFDKDYDLDSSYLDYASVRKSAHMIGSLYLLDRNCPNKKQRITAVIHSQKLILYQNGKNPQIPLLIIDLFKASIFEGIEANARFCICTGQEKHEFEALDDEERSEWVNELKKVANATHFDYDLLDNEEEEEVTNEDLYNDDGSSIYEEVGDARRIYDVPKTFVDTSESSAIPQPPPLPNRFFAIDEDEADFPPPPDFLDEVVITKIVPPPPPPPAPKPPTSKMIPPPPPPNSSKIHIFSKSPLKLAISNSSKALKAVSSSSDSISNKKSASAPAQSNNNSSKKKTEALQFDEELRQKIETTAAKRMVEMEAMLKNRSNSLVRNEAEVEAELEAILRRRREKLGSAAAKPDVRKTASFRMASEAAKFNTLPHKGSTFGKPKLPDKKPAVFARAESMKIQSWNRISGGSTEENESPDEEQQLYSVPIPYFHSQDCSSEFL